MQATESLEEIGTDALYGCTQLKRIDLPASVSLIGSDGTEEAWYGTFADCSGLTHIEITKTNDFFCSEEGVLYNKNKKILRQYPPGRTEKTYEIPEGTRLIAHQALEKYRHLETVVLPSSTERIEKAFRSCDHLRTVVCKGENPPIGYAIGTKYLVKPFDADLMNNGKLIVPSGTKSRYKKNVYLDWGMFKNIEKKAFATSVSSVEKPQARVTKSGKNISIHAGPTETILFVRIYSSSG